MISFTSVNACRVDEVYSVTKDGKFEKKHTSKSPAKDYTMEQLGSKDKNIWDL